MGDTRDATRPSPFGSAGAGTAGGGGAGAMTGGGAGAKTGGGGAIRGDGQPLLGRTDAHSQAKAVGALHRSMASQGEWVAP
mgnify:CR=1 FL=1